MRCVDSTFCFDILQEDPGAARRAEEFDASAEHLTIAVPALLEVLEAGYRRGRRYLRRVQDLVGRFEVLEVNERDADEGARLGADCVGRGETVPHMDLLIAATAKRHGQVIVTRDPGFGQIPGLTVEPC